MFAQFAMQRRRALPAAGMKFEIAGNCVRGSPAVKRE